MSSITETKLAENLASDATFATMVGGIDFATGAEPTIFSIRYVDVNGAKTERDVAPLSPRSLFENGEADVNYLNAFCYLRNEVRVFETTRVQGAPVELDEVADINPHDFVYPAWNNMARLKPIRLIARDGNKVVDLAEGRGEDEDGNEVRLSGLAYGEYLVSTGRWSWTPAYLRDRINVPMGRRAK